MESLEQNRHTLAHLLAAAVLIKYPHAKPTIGPAVDNGFYYDFDFGGGDAPGEMELMKLAKEMRSLLPSWKEFSHKEVSAQEAREVFANNQYKIELIDELEKEGSTITLYTCGNFTDLCRGGHCEHPSKDISKDSFQLDRVAGAYWRGDEKNSMLTRIYGLAFENKEQLDAYISQREEAKKRDHRILGKELDLFTFSDLIGPGLPLWTPRGTIMRKQLDEFVWELREKYNYQRVTIPHITKQALYETSGHWDKFTDELFRVNSREDKGYALKPMNCPHHTQIFARKPHSYREMPQRYAETTMVYRDEQSGELGGLTRVLSITQDDSHVFCRHSQVKEEFFKIWDIIDTFYNSFGFTLRVRLSFHNPDEMDKYLGTPEIWQNSEDALRKIAEERKADYFEAPGEAAMYGPKLDFMATDSMGRQHQVATIQLDMNLPERFDLTCVNEDGEKERIVIIHCAVMGSLERFIAVLIEHTAGKFPTWLAPIQTKVIPISDAQTEYAHEIAELLKEAGVRAVIDNSSETLGKRIRDAKIEKAPYILVVGDQEKDSKTVAPDSRDNGKMENVSIADFIALISKEITERK